MLRQEEVLVADDLAGHEVGRLAEVLGQRPGEGLKPVLAVGSVQDAGVWIA